MERQHCFLVLRRGRIDGLVTQSDLVKLPVRMLLFGLMSHLELCLRALVAQRAPYPAWLDRLSGESRRRVEGEFKRAALARLDPDPLEFTTFSDVVALLKRERDLAANFLDEMETIRQFRNDIAHAKSYVQSAEDVPRIVSTFASIRKWIESLSNSVRIVR
jgi:hypothetical protein